MSVRTGITNTGSVWEKKKSVKTEINFQPIKTSSSFSAVIKTTFNRWQVSEAKI